MVSLWGETLTLESQAFLAAYRPGGVALFGNNVVSPQQVTALTNAIQAEVTRGAPSVPVWIAIDEEGGLVSRLQAGFTTFPAPMAIAATDDAAYAFAIGAAMAEELRAIGINMDLAPVADVETNPDNPVIARRAFSSDPRRVAEMSSAMIQGLQTAGVMATAKHFPGHGATTVDSHLGLPEIDVDRARLDAVELVPFRLAIASGVGTIMAGHLWYPILDPEPDSPASLSAPVLTGLLRNELAFEGLIMTDALDMDAIDQRYSLANAAQRAILAGADLVTPGPHVSLATQQAAIDAVVAAVEAGDIPLARIEDSARRILTLKARFGVLSWTPLDPATVETRLHLADHAGLVDALLANALTLVYDRTDLVPLATDHRLALVYPATTPSIARECMTYAPDLRLVGVSLGPTPEEIAWAVDAGLWAETTVVFTYDAVDNPAQQQLVRALDPTRTVVVALRSPYDWQTFPDVAAYLATYTPLLSAVPAACAGLFGAAPITGRLPMALAPDLPAGSGISRP